MFEHEAFEHEEGVLDGTEPESCFTMGANHVILVNLGTPAAPTEEAVRAFLREFLLDPLVVDYPRWFWKPILERLVLRSRPGRVAERYRTLWTDGGSPLEVGTRKMVESLQARLGSDHVVSFAYRYGSPSITAAMVARRCPSNNSKVRS